MPRYVPKTYNNRRALRVIFGTVIALALLLVILFLVLFFILGNYVEDGRLDIPWLLEETVPIRTPDLSEDIPDPSDDIPDPSDDTPAAPDE